MYAYKLKAYQVIGPDWIKSSHWDIAATLPEGANKDQVPEMMQALLADRFKLEMIHAPRGARMTAHLVFA